MTVSTGEIPADPAEFASAPADAPFPSAVAADAQRLIVLSMAAFLAIMLMAFVLADALQPVTRAWMAAAITGVLVTSVGCVIVAWLGRRAIRSILRQPHGRSLWAYVDYASVGTSLFPGVVAIIGAFIASVAVQLADSDAAGAELVLIATLLAVAVFPGLHAVLSVWLQRIGSWHETTALGGEHDTDGNPDGVLPTTAMVGLGTRIAMAVSFTALAAVAWFAMYVARLSTGSGTVGGPTSVVLAATMFLVVAVFNSLTIRSALRLSIDAVRRQLEEMRSGETRMVAAPGLDELGRLTSDVRAIAADQAALATAIRSAADGDLSVQIDTRGAVGASVADLVETARELVRTIDSISGGLGEDSEAILDHSTAVETDAREQSLNVDESRRTMLGLRQCSQEINNESHELNAASQDVLAVNEHTASQISSLVDHQVQVEELLDTVREIAERSDILALNASLEGVRAGESGRGFSLVAGEMRRMAEKVKSAASDIRQIVANVRTSARATMAATEEAQRVGERMKKSVERIALIASQQQTSTLQVTTNIADVAAYLQQASEDTGLARELAESLSSGAARLHGLIEHFRIPVIEEWEGGDGGGVVFDSDDNIVVFRPSGRHHAVGDGENSDGESEEDVRAREAAAAAMSDDGESDATNDGSETADDDGAPADADRQPDQPEPADDGDGDANDGDSDDGDSDGNESRS